MLKRTIMCLLVLMLLSWSSPVSADSAQTYVNKAMAYAKRGQWRYAVAAYTKVAQLRPRVARTYIERAFAYMKLGQYKKSIADSDKAIRMKPRQHIDAAYQYKALCHIKLEQYDQAFAAADKAVKINPRNSTYLNSRSMASLGLGKFDVAEMDIERAIKLTPAEAVLYQNRGSLYLATRRYDKALKDFQYAARLNPREGFLWMGSAVCMMKKKDYDNAFKYATRAIALDPKSLAYSVRAESSFVRGNLSAALADCKDAIKYGDAQGFYIRAQINEKQSNKQEALEDYKQFIEQVPKVGYSFAFKQFAKKNIEEAKKRIEYLGQAIASSGESTQADSAADVDTKRLDSIAKKEEEIKRDEKGENEPPRKKKISVRPGKETATVFSELESIVKEYYPKAKISRDSNSIHIEFKARKMNIHNKGMRLIPRHGGIVCDVEVKPGKYPGKEHLPLRTNETLYVSVLMAPYSQHDDRHLLTRLLYPPSADAGLIQRVKETVHGFKSVPSASTQ